MTLPMRRGRYAARRWDPFSGFPAVDDLFEQMSRMLTTAFPDVARISVHSWSPPVNVQETDDEYTVEADLPGVRHDDVDVDLQGRELRIVGEYGSTEQGEGEQRRSRRSGRFDYRVTLPGEVDSESCTAELENGVLRLRLPKASSGRRQRIPVQGASAQAIESDSEGSTSSQSGQSATQAESAQQTASGTGADEQEASRGGTAEA